MKIEYVYLTKNRKVKVKKRYNINFDVLFYYFLLKYSCCEILYKLQVYNIVTHNL